MYDPEMHYLDSLSCLKFKGFPLGPNHGGPSVVTKCIKCPAYTVSKVGMHETGSILFKDKTV